MLTLARSELPVRPEKFDRNRFLLNCKNGTIDLSTGRLKPHDKEDYITKAVSVNYDPDATCPQWEKFLDRIMDNNVDLIRFLRGILNWAIEGCLEWQRYGLGTPAEVTKATEEYRNEQEENYFSCMI